MKLSKQQISVVTMSTIAFTVCFAVWMMFAVIGIPIKKLLDLNETQFGLLIAMPVLSGSLIRLPLGMWTDKFGGRIVFFVLMLSTVVPIYLISYASAFWHFLVIGLFVGLAGGSFSVGIAYVAHWFPKKSARLGHGNFRRRQLRSCGDQVCCAGNISGLRLANGASGLCSGDADHRTCFLDVYLF